MGELRDAGRGNGGHEERFIGSRGRVRGGCGPEGRSYTNEIHQVEVRVVLWDWKDGCGHVR